MLRIEVQGLSLQKRAEGTLYLEVEGSRSGLLASEPVPAAKPEWNPYFKIDCNQSDRLLFRIVCAWAGVANEVGRCELFCARFVKENRKQLSWEDPTEYHLDILEDETIAGTINTFMWFDSTVSFEGEFPHNVSLSLNSFKEPLPIYMGKCVTSNAFSFLDEPTQGQYCKFSESIYRDHQ